MSARALRAALLAAALLGGAAAMAADDAATRPARVDHVADLLVTMLPMGEIFDETAAKDPRWPLGDKAAKLPEDKLKCMRGELSSDGFRRQRVVEVREYYRNVSDDQLANDLRVLDGGAAVLLRKFMQAGFEAKRSGKPVDQAKAMEGATGAQMASMVEFVQSPDFKGLRKLSGLGDSFSGNRSATESEDAGKSAGASLVTKFMFKAMDTCSVPPASLL